MPQTPRIGFVSLGCPKALVDSERILTRLRAEGYAIAPRYDDADLVVVNTCGFIDSAVEESCDAIAEALRENGRVIVTGCLGARAERLRNDFPALLAVTGPHAEDEVLEAVHAHAPAPHAPFESLIPPAGIKLTPRHYAYLKISEGCNHHCSFCIIPALRGPLVSRGPGEVLDEAERLVASGVRELLVVAQDTAAYGMDRRHRTAFWQGRPMKTRLPELATALGSLGAWVRLMYVYPYPSVDELIPLMAEGHLVPYLDVPLQHATPRILRAMKRPAAAENALARLRRWRETCPDLTVRSSFIVGFPGETEDDFERLVDFLHEAQLDRVGCFTYSPVEGAAANAIEGAVPEEVKEARRMRLMQTQEAISTARLRRLKGRTMRVLVDEVDGSGAVGRSTMDAPEIDGRVHLTGRGIQPGEFVDVRITRTDAHDLHGRVAR